MINIIKKDNKNYFFIKSIFIRTSLVFIFAYFTFHFLNGNISLSPLADKKQLLEESTQVLLKKEKILVFKELMISRLNDSEENMDLLDELIRDKLGYSGKDEVIISNK